MSALDTSLAKTASDLEWSALLEAVASGCASSVGSERIRSLLPATTLADARRRMALTAEVLEALAQAEPVPAAGALELAESLEHVRRGGVLEAETLVAVRRTLEGARELRSYLDSRREALPLLATHLDSEPELSVLAREIGRCLDDKGNVLDAAFDAASTALRSARRQVSSLRGEQADRVRKLAKRHAALLREGGPVERDGRFALPVRADTHKRVQGIVLGSSATGATLYVEPPELTAITNRLTLALAEVEREVARVLDELSSEVRERIDAIAVAHEACIEADVLAAMSTWAQRTRARALPIDDDALVDLTSMRHPLLLAQGEVDVVPNDIRVDASSALVISGPNAGGKTVALKCVGLAVWMARAGIPVPTGEGSRLGWYARLLTDIGDAQSLERSLSTFSAEVVALRAILELADAQTLVLLDEVAGGTDPEEGAALAAAVLEELVSSGATTLVTTHYERLKEMAADTPGFVNASVGFDFDAMQPTFRLTIGQPGASSALAVAERFGLSSGVLSRARDLLSEDAVRREELIADLERQRNALANAREAAERDAETAEELLAEAEKERRVAREKERKRLAREAEDLIDRVKKARGRLRDLEALPRDEAQRAVDGAAKLVSASSELARASRDPDRVPPKAASEEPIRAGMHVYVERLGTTAEVIEAPSRGEVRVQAGAFGLRVPLSEVRVDPRKKKKSKASRSKPAKTKRMKPRPEPDRPEIRTSDNTCDLRGARVDEALNRLDGFIDGCLRRAESVAFVLHGYGTGALRNAVREHLALHSYIARSRAATTDEGGDAFTVFWLRD
jgi:DNA mismatch repair protein MutS2